VLESVRLQRKSYPSPAGDRSEALGLRALALAILRQSWAFSPSSQVPSLRSRALRQTRRRRDHALTGERVEPWRDWAILMVLSHGMLLTVALWRPSWTWLLLASIPLGAVLATATLTVLHDAGHRRLSRRTWLNILAVQTAAPIGLWVGHWTLKHRVHHRVTQVYPLDDSTRSSGLVRLHPSAPRWAIHRFQHLYAWVLYGLAWVGELRSQLTYLRTGELSGIQAPPPAVRLRSFCIEKAVCLLVVAPYAWLLGLGRFALLLAASMTVGSLIAAVILVVGHINTGLSPSSSAPEGRHEWAAHLVRTSASFRTESPVARWLTGGMTHHLAHHLRATAPRAELPTLHKTAVADLVAASGVPAVEYPTFFSAVAGHWRVLRVLGQPEPVSSTTQVMQEFARIPAPD
jgi:linoleoyl-CoA desaturase